MVNNISQINNIGCIVAVSKMLVVSSCFLFFEGLKEIISRKILCTIIHASTNREAIELLNPATQMIFADVPSDEWASSLLLFKNAKMLSVKILAFSTHTEYSKIKAIMDAGASGYLLKSSSCEMLFEAMNAVMKGDNYIDKRLGSYFFQSLASPNSANKRFENQKALSKRECEVLRLAGKDLSSKEIAKALFISHSTVETHRKKIISKLGVKSITGALDVAYRRGILELG